MKAIVIGSGIMGLATARVLGLRGFETLVLERNPKAQGSSIRNFGMVWPIGQPEGQALEWALKSRSIWLELASQGAIWHQKSGSIMALRNAYELALAHNFLDVERGRTLSMLHAEEAVARAPYLKRQGLLGALYSDSEIIVEARQAIRVIPDLLSATSNIRFRFNTAVKETATGYVITARGEKIDADIIVICNGYDFATLYPAFFDTVPMTLSVLQMLRSEALSLETPPICAGLTFLHYPSYQKLENLEEYKVFCGQRYPKLIEYGIHLLVSQNEQRCLTIGDSHVYGRDIDPFREEEIDSAILDYFHEVFDIPELKIKQRWNGTYAKLTNGFNHLLQEVDKGVWVFNGPGGAGMTLSFGMADDLIAKL